jgi:hypothetical protein
MEGVKVFDLPYVIRDMSVEGKVDELNDILLKHRTNFVSQRVDVPSFRTKSIQISLCPHPFIIFCVFFSYQIHVESILACLFRW